MKLLFSVFVAFVVLLGLDMNHHTNGALQSRVFPRSYVEISGTTDSNLLPIITRYNTLVIRQGNGGLVYGMIDVVKYLRVHPRKRVIIDGPCYSACTLLLNAPHNVVLTQNARMFFHSSSHEICRDGLMVSEMSGQANTDMWRMFKRPIRKWITSSKAYASTSFTMLPTELLEKWYSQMIVIVPSAPDTTSQVAIDAEVKTSQKTSRPKPCPFRIEPILP